MPVSRCRKRSLLAQQLVDGGAFVFGPGGQEAIVPPVLPSSAQSQSSQSTAQTTVSQVLVTTAFTVPSSTASAFSSTATVSIAPASYPPVISSVSSTTVLISAPSSSPSPWPSTSESPSSQATSSPSIATGTSASNESPDAAASTHSAPFYVGIVLGVILVISCLAALVAWWVRLYSRSKRRRDAVDTYVPWGKPRTDDDDELEGNPYLGSSCCPSDREKLGGNDAFQSWNLTGDRDVGEPKRSSSFFDSPSTSPVKRPPVPPYALLHGHYPNVNHSYPLADSVAFPLPSAYTVSRPIPNQQGSCDSDSAQSLGPLQVTNMMPGDVAPSRPETVLDMANPGEPLFGTPREPFAGSKPRFQALDGHGLQVPWARSRLDAKELASTTAQPDFFPAPQRKASTYSGTPGDGWTASLRLNLEKAINLVSNNLGSGGPKPDHLTPAPRRIGQRQSLQGSGWGEHRDGRLVRRPLSRGSTASSTSSQLSKAWTLEETGDGAGVVHFSSSDKHGFPNAMSIPVSECTESDDADRCSVPNSTSDLNLARIPPSAVLGRPTIQSQLHRRPLSFVSRASSVYSTASAISSICSRETSCARQLGSTAHPRLGRTERLARNAKRRHTRRGNMARDTSS